MVYTPPPGRAEQGGFSVGYDQYDRFDLGKPGSPTLYGTEAGLRKLVDVTHKAGASYTVDYVMNHNGFADLGSTDGDGDSFYDAGGYPGF
jgi:alpha-amylase